MEHIGLIQQNFNIEGYMNLGKITIVTPPDKLFNLNPNYLIVNPSLFVKQQLQQVLSSYIDDVNVFIYEQDENDVDWLLSVAHMVDVVIIDIDNCSTITKQFVTYLLSMPNVHYITSDEITPYNLISKNRIYNLEWLTYTEEEEDNSDDDESED
jgi:hypothetical protein